MNKLNDIQIQKIQCIANDRITEILDSLGVEYRERIDYLQGKCPIHDGDNPRSFYWALKTNHWRCKTRNCDKDIITGKSHSVFGLVRGIMSNKTNRQWSFRNSVRYVAKLLGIDVHESDTQYSQEEIEIDKAINAYKRRLKSNTKRDGIPLIDVTPQLRYDTVYYPSRGVSEDIIRKYHISYCNNPKKPFYKRAFFPILSEDGKFIVGWSGRSIWHKCEKCNLHHDAKIKCPDSNYSAKYAKWRHSAGFRSEKYLYNYWYARHSINKYALAIVCEGPGDCWAYEQAGIKISVAILGLNFSKEHVKLLQRAGALTLVFVLDNDEAGRKAQNKLENELIHYFRLIFVNTHNVKDVGDMLPLDVREKFEPLIKTYGRENIYA